MDENSVLSPPPILPLHACFGAAANLAVASILQTIRGITGAAFAAVALVTEDHWIACALADGIGLGIAPGSAFAGNRTVCHQARQTGETATLDGPDRDRFPLPAMATWQSYLSTPILLPDGSCFGTLCAIDPRRLELEAPATRGMFASFARLIGFYAQAERCPPSATPPHRPQIDRQFLALLGHELRNPLATINMSAWLLGRNPPADRAAGAVEAINSSVLRMSGLIANMLDFAGDRLDRAIVRDADEPLEPALRAAVTACRQAWPHRLIIEEFAIAAPIECDRARITHLASNLLRNALSYGAAGQPVRLHAASVRGEFELAVENQGDPIPPEIQQRLVRLFASGEGALSTGPNGLGLGLYVASAIARAHGGVIELRSTAGHTSFRFVMPLTGG